jgi:hypothetical protein
MSYAHSKENQPMCIISSWLSSKFFHLTLHLLFFPLTGTVQCVLPTIRLCSYNQSYLIYFYMDQRWGCCISFGEWAEGSRAWPASPCKDQRICRCSSSKLHKQLLSHLRVEYVSSWYLHCDLNVQGYWEFIFSDSFMLLFYT